jgi:hypothetical protein
MSKPNKPAKFAEIETAIKAMLEAAKTFDERKQSIDTAIKFEALKLKAKGGGYGRGFTEEEGAEDEID